MATWYVGIMAAWATLLTVGALMPPRKPSDGWTGAIWSALATWGWVCFAQMLGRI